MSIKTINVNWVLANQSSTARTFFAQADIGGSSNFSMDVQINLPPDVDPYVGVLLFIQPVGNFFNFPATDAFCTRVLSIDIAAQSAVIHITRVDIQSGWDMDLKFNFLSVNPITY